MPEIKLQWENTKSLIYHFILSPKNNSGHDFSVLRLLYSRVLAALRVTRITKQAEIHLVQVCALVNNEQVTRP